MDTVSRLTDDEVATLSEEFVERNMLPQSPTEAFRTVNSVHSYMLITNMKKLAEKEYEAYKDLKDSEPYHINVLHEETVELVEVNKQALLNLAEGRKKYGGLDLLGVKAVDFSQSAIEVKADREGKYLHRDTPDWDEGSLGFEIWAHPDRSKMGWAYDYINYESKTKWMVNYALTNRFVPATYCFPSVFVYVLGYEIGREFHPYATICFENTEALFDLIDAKFDGRLKNWRKQYKTDIIQEGLLNGAYMQYNILYIRMNELCTLPDVTVTLFEDIPDNNILLSSVDQRYRARKQQLIEQRKRYLCSESTTNEVREQRTEAERLILKQNTEKYKRICSMTDNR